MSLIQMQIQELELQKAVYPQLLKEIDMVIGAKRLMADAVEHL